MVLVRRDEVEKILTNLIIDRMLFQQEEIWLIFGGLPSHHLA